MNIVYSGVILTVYCFVVITCYVFISGPFDDVITGFEDVNMTSSDYHVDESGTLLRTVFDMTFGGLIIVPIILFIYYVFYREPNWRFR